MKQLTFENKKLIIDGCPVTITISGTPKDEGQARFLRRFVASSFYEPDRTTVMDFVETNSG